MLTVTFLHPNTDATIALELPRETKFAALTPLLYERKFIRPQRPGFSYLYAGHLCGMEHTLGDYVPEKAKTMTVQVFDVPVIMV